MYVHVLVNVFCFSLLYLDDEMEETAQSQNNSLNGTFTQERQTSECTETFPQPKGNIISIFFSSKSKSLSTVVLNS